MLVMAILGTCTYFHLLGNACCRWIYKQYWVEHLQLSAAIVSSERELLTGMCSTMYSVDVAIADICNVF